MSDKITPRAKAYVEAYRELNRLQRTYRSELFGLDKYGELGEAGTGNVLVFELERASKHGHGTVRIGSIKTPIDRYLAIMPGNVTQQQFETVKKAKVKEEKLYDSLDEDELEAIEDKLGEELR